jgi:hypothetical protein
MPHYTLTLTGRMAILLGAALIVLGYLIGRL